jgi:hypothetical protein
MDEGFEETGASVVNLSASVRACAWRQHTWAPKRPARWCMSQHRWIRALATKKNETMPACKRRVQEYHHWLMLHRVPHDTPQGCCTSAVK